MGDGCSRDDEVRLKSLTSRKYNKKGGKIAPFPFDIIHES